MEEQHSRQLSLKIIPEMQAWYPFNLTAVNYALSSLCSICCAGCRHARGLCEHSTALKQPIRCACKLWLLLCLKNMGVISSSHPFSCWQNGLAAQILVDEQGSSTEADS
jgi:hypothetical protein